MNTNSGRIYEIGQDFEAALSQPLVDQRKGALEALLEEERAMTADEMQAAMDVARGDTVVPVSAQVAHTMKLGQRELDRRKRRRQEQRKGRKQNR